MAVALSLREFASYALLATAILIIIPGGLPPAGAQVVSEAAVDPAAIFDSRSVYPAGFTLRNGSSTNGGGIKTVSSSGSLIASWYIVPTPGAI